MDYRRSEFANIDKILKVPMRCSNDEPNVRVLFPNVQEPFYLSL